MNNEINAEVEKEIEESEYTVQEIANAAIINDRAVILWINRGRVPRKKRVKLRATKEEERYLIKGKDLRYFFLKVLGDKRYWRLVTERLTEQTCSEPKR